MCTPSRADVHILTSWLGCRKYDLKGLFRGCTQMEGVKRFFADELALRPIRIETLGPFMWVLFNNDQ